MLLTHYRVLYTQQERVDQEDVRMSNTDWLIVKVKMWVLNSTKKYFVLVIHSHGGKNI